MVYCQNFVGALEIKFYFQVCFAEYTYQDNVKLKNEPSMCSIGIS